MDVGEIGGCCKSYCFVLTLVREKSGNFKVHLLCEPCYIQHFSTIYIYLETLQNTDIL